MRALIIQVVVILLLLLAEALWQRCETLAAYATVQLGQSTNEGFAFVSAGVGFEPIDRDGSRVGKVLFTHEGNSP